jgi:hypothetical protein
VEIGAIVRSNSHTSYMCRVYGKLDAGEIPPPESFAFGTFVSLQPLEGSDVTLVGVISNTLLVNPDYGGSGPRLSSERELEVFAPDYLEEKGVLVDILILGWFDRLGAHHGVPALAAQVGTRVTRMPDDHAREFHTDGRGRFLAGYLPALMTHNDPTISALLLSVLERLAPDFPDQARVIAVLRNNLAWRSRVVPTG